MAQPDVVLERLFARYRSALNANRAARSPDLAAADAVIEARVCLYEYLVATGWDPPPIVRRQLKTDALLLEQPPSLLAG